MTPPPIDRNPPPDPRGRPQVPYKVELPPPPQRTLERPPNVPPPPPGSPVERREEVQARDKEKRSDSRTQVAPARVKVVRPGVGGVMAPPPPPVRR